MKKLFYILFAASAVLFVSCAKEMGDNNTASDAKLTGETITFTASMDMPFATRAALSSLNINWQSGDYIGFATDNDATIRVYPVTVDGEDPTKCTVTVTKVDGASAYYALFKGSLGHSGGANEVAADDFSMITFNTSTKTFSGLTVGNQQVTSGSLSSHLWYTNGYPLAMAGKASGASLSMKPCLALVRLGINAESVPAGYFYSTIVYNNPTYGIDHPHDYTAVRGFNFYQKGASTIYSSGDYNVQIADNGSLTTTAAGNNSEYRQLAGSEKMSVDTDYLMCVIPGGTVSSFKIGFLGWTANSASSYNYSASYTMTKGGISSVNPGDYYDLGVLNPLGRKKAANEAADDAADAVAGVANVVDIDGVFDDWDGVTEYPGTRTSGSSNSRINGWRMTQDVHNVYVYLDLAKTKFAGPEYYKPNSYIYVCFDTEEGGSTVTSIPGVDKKVLIYPCVANSDPVAFIEGADPRSEVNGSSDGTIETWGVFGTGANEAHAYIELSIPRSKLSLTTPNQTIQIGVSFQEYDAAKQSIKLD